MFLKTVKAIQFCKTDLENYRKKEVRDDLTGQDKPMFDYDKDTITANGETITLNEAAKRCDAFDDHIRSLEFEACSGNMFTLEEISAGGKWGTTAMYHISSKSTDFIAETARSGKSFESFGSPNPCTGSENSKNEITTDGEALLEKVQKVCGKNAHIEFKGNWYVTPINQVSSRRTMDVSCGGKLTKKWYADFGK